MGRVSTMTLVANQRRFCRRPLTSPHKAIGPAMLAKLQTFSLLGIDALPVEVEVDVSDGALLKTVLVGLPEAAVKECVHRVATNKTNQVKRVRTIFLKKSK